MAVKNATTEEAAVENKSVILQVIREFIDKTNNEYRKKHSIFEASQTRAQELIRLGFCKKI